MKPEDRQQAILDSARKFWARNHYAPDAMDIATDTRIHDLHTLASDLNALEEKNIIHRDPGGGIHIVEQEESTS